MVTSYKNYVTIAAPSTGSNLMAGGNCNPSLSPFSFGLFIYWETTYSYFFSSQQPNRTYYLEDPEENADGWVDKVEEVHKMYYGKSGEASTP